MPKFPYVANRNAPKDAFIEKVQRMLNYLRNRFHCGWPHLEDDGRYGPITADAVKGFQIWYTCKGNGILDSKTYEQIEKSLKISPNISLTHGYANNKLYDSLEYITDKIIKPFVDTIKSCSESAEKELRKLRSQNISSNDMKKLARSIFENPQLESIKSRIHKEVYEMFQEKAKGNTNVINYKFDTKTKKTIEGIKIAQREISKGFSNNTLKLIDKRVVNELLEKSIAELDSINFANKITQKINSIPQLKSAGNVRITGNGILTTLMLFPLALHILQLIDCLICGKPSEDIIKQIIADIISLIEGILISIVIGLIVTAIELFGGIAVLVGVIIGLIVGIIIMIFFPEHEKNIADKIYRFFDSIFHSPVYQQSVKTSFA